MNTHSLFYFTHLFTTSLFSTYKFIEPTPESHIFFLGVCINVQKAMRLGGSILVHLHKILFLYGIGKILIDLLELFLVTHHVHYEMSGIEPDHSGKPCPGLYQKTDGKGEMSVLDTDMTHEICSPNTIQICTLTVIHDQHVGGFVGFGGQSMIPAFQHIGVFQRHDFLPLPKIVVHMLIQHISFILGPIPLHLSHDIVQSPVPPSRVITHILLLIQRIEVVKNVIGGLGGANEKGSGDILLLLKMATHGHTGISLPTPSGATEHKHGRQFGVSV